MFFDSFLSSSMEVANYSLFQLSLNLLRMVFKTSLGSFLDLTVLMRSGISALLSFFIVLINFFCWISLKMAMLLANSSRFLVNQLLFLVKASQLTKESAPVCSRMKSKLFQISSILTQVIINNYIITVKNKLNLITSKTYFNSHVHGMLLMLVYSTQLGFKNELEYNIMNVHRIQELRQPDSERRLDGNNQR